MSQMTGGRACTATRQTECTQVESFWRYIGDQYTKRQTDGDATLSAIVCQLYQ